VSEGADPRLAGARWLTSPESRRMFAALTAGGRPARFVGGCVRDTLLDPTTDPHDLDIATAEPPQRVIELLRAAAIRVIPTGIEHGTVTALCGAHAYEVTTLRRDVSTDGRRATVAFTEDFVEDAARRDFTINALSCDGAGRLFDPFGGLADLEAGRIRFVGDPQKRIREDHLRILRWFRFFARFGREPPDAAALAACATEAPSIARLSGERIQHELFRLLAEPGAVRAVELMAAHGILARTLPVPLAVPPLAALRRAGAGGDPILALGAMLRGAGADPDAARRVADRLRLSRADALRLRRLVAAPRPAAPLELAGLRRLADEVGVADAVDRLAIAAAEADLDAPARAALERALREAPPPAFPLSGDDLLAAGVAPGPGIGRLLGAVRAWWRERDFRPDRAACLARLAELRAAAAAPDGAGGSP
jgi:poly(A) polymerase